MKNKTLDNIIDNTIFAGTMLVLGMCAGACIHFPPAKRYEGETFNITLDSQYNINKEYHKRNTNSVKNVKGFFSYKENTAYAPYTDQKDIHGKQLPDFCTLGHEVWHHPKFGGRYHE